METERDRESSVVLTTPSITALFSISSTLMEYGYMECLWQWSQKLFEK